MLKVIYLPLVSAVSAGMASWDPLIRAHGILMIVTWPVLAVTGIFFAAWMKPALPKAEWFQVCCMYECACVCVSVHVYAYIQVGVPI